MSGSVERGNSITDGYRRRMEAGYALWAKANNAGTQALFATEVSVIAGRSFSANSVLGWVRGAVPSTLESMVAVADLVGVPPGWLYFGEEVQTDAIEAVLFMRQALNAKAHGSNVDQAKLELKALELYYAAHPERRPMRIAENEAIPVDQVARKSATRKASGGKP